TIQSDYLCVSRIISEIVDNIDGDKIYNLTLGESAPLVMSGKDPKDYLHQESFELENTQQKGSKYEINVKAVFTESLTHADIDYDGYQYNIIETWNPNSILCGFIIQIETKLEWGKLGAQSLCSALAKYGFKYAVGEKKIDGEGGGGFIRKGHIWGSMEYASNSCKLMFIDLNVVPNSEAFIESLIAKLPSEQREELREP
ncbi:MAG: hypothetical protein K2G53_01360, partial [Muribaculaceae bacterium]|nr:hypothetical protein [Muribaculaceae bacterium]